MARGINSVQGHGDPKRHVHSAAGGSAPVRGPSLSTGDYLGLCKALAERSAPLSAEERAAFDTLRAREMARAEANRAGPSPQGDLELAA